MYITYNESCPTATRKRNPRQTDKKEIERMYICTMLMYKNASHSRRGLSSNASILKVLDVKPIVTKSHNGGTYDPVVQCVQSPHVLSAIRMQVATTAGGNNYGFIKKPAGPDITRMGC
jgi:hypothetical protein